MKKYLLITYYWPPCGGVAVQRWLKLTKYLSLYGYNASILTTEKGDYSFIDESLTDNPLSDKLSQITLIRIKTPIYHKIYNFILGKKERLPSGSLKTKGEDPILKKILYWVRRHFIAPDARVFWNNNAINAAKKVLSIQKHDIIITTGPPHSTHLIGANVIKHFDIKWIADFRDPWTNITYNINEKKNFFIKKIDYLLEKRVISKADVVVTVSNVFAQNLLTGNKRIIPNAFDNEDFIGIDYQQSNSFRIKYIGTLPESRIKPAQNIVNWIIEYLNQNQIDDIEISIIGAFQNVPNDFKDKVMNIPFVTHKKAIEECINSEILLLIINQESFNEGIITHKLYDYLGSKSIIFAIGPKDTELEKILLDSKGGILFSYTDKSYFLESLDITYKKWKKGMDIKNKTDVSKYSMDNIAKMYCDILNELYQML